MRENPPSMSWHAVDAVDDAVTATRRFLFPFSLVRWTKLALLVLLMGGIGTNVSVPFVPDPQFSTFEGVEGEPAPMPDAIDAELLLAVGAAAVVLLALFSVISLALKLVFYDALHTNEVRLWRPFVGRLRQAIGLFVLSVAVSAAVAVTIVAAVLAGVSTGFAPADRIGSTVAGLPDWGVAVLVPLAALFALVALLVLRFTDEFVVPVMVLRDDGVLAAWGRFWPTLRGAWTQFLLYLFVHFFLGLGISIVESVLFLFIGGVVAVLAGVVLLIVAGILGGIPALTGTTVGIVVLAVVVVVALGVLLLLSLPVRVVTRTYLIAYEVSTLGGVDPELAMLDRSIDPAADGSSGPSGPSESSDRSGRSESSGPPEGP